MVQMGFAKDQVKHIALAVDEAASNVIRHGYKGTCERPIWVKVSPTKFKGKQAVSIVLEDECTGVDLSKIKGRPLEDYRPGGLGVHLILGLMDFVEYSHMTKDRGVRLEMIKCIDPADSEAVKAEMEKVEKR
jgi:anti-sigma regulatory factor (Ser/Thr protein kinase)